MKALQFIVHSFLVTALLASPAASGQDAVRLGLEQSIISAIENNLDIAVQRAKPKAGEKDVIQLESEFDTSLFGGLSYAKTQTPSLSPLSSPAVGESATSTASVGFQQKLTLGTTYKLTADLNQTDTNSSYAGVNPQYSNNLELAVTQPLLKGMGRDVNSSRIVIAQNTKQMSEEDLAAKVMDIVTQTQETYWDLVYLNGQLEVQIESLERAKDFKKQVETKVELGVLAPIEVTSAEATIAVREQSLIGIRQSIFNAQDKLEMLMNRKDLPLGSPVAIVPTDPPVYKDVPLGIGQLLEAAYENRPECRQSQLAIESKRNELAFNKNQLYPSVDLNGSVKLKGVRGSGRTVIFNGQPVVSNLAGGQGDAFGDMAGGKFYDYSVGVSVAYLLSNRSAKSKVAKSMIELDADEMSLASLRQQVEMQVLTAARDVEASGQSIQASHASSVLSAKKLEAENSKYKVGASTSFLVLQYQNDLASAQSAEIKAATDYLKALARLEKATGTVLQKHNITIAQQDK